MIEQLSHTSFNLWLAWWLSDKKSACSAGDLGSIPVLGRSSEEGNELWLKRLKGSSLHWAVQIISRDQDSVS